MKKILVLLFMWVYLIYFSMITIVFILVALPQWLRSKDYFGIIVFTLILFAFWFVYFKIRRYAIKKGYIKNKKEKNANKTKKVSDIRSNQTNETKIDLKTEIANNEKRIKDETYDIIKKSKNIDTVLSRIEFGKDKGFITDSIDDLQIEAIERCYNLTIEKSTEKNKQRNVDKYIKVVNEHRESFSPTVLASLNKLVQQPIIISVETKIEHNLPFDDEYLNTVLDDGKTIREHMQEGFDEAMKKSNMMDEQEDIKLNDMEADFIKAFINTLKPYGLDTAIRYNRMSSGVLNFTYKAMQIGRIKLRGKKMNIQVLYDDSKGWDVKYFDVTTLEDATSHIDEWMNYLQSLIKDEKI